MYLNKSMFLFTYSNYKNFFCYVCYCYNLQRLIQQHEVGIKKRLIQRWTPKKPTCDSAKKNRNYVSVSIKEILPTIILFGYGLLISLTVLVLELAYYYGMHYFMKRFKKIKK